MKHADAHPPPLAQKGPLSERCWLAVTLVPVFAARTGLTWGPWPVDFWMAAQGCVLAYLLIVCVYAGLVNRWERQAGSLSFEIPPTQDV